MIRSEVTKQCKEECQELSSQTLKSTLRKASVSQLALLRDLNKKRQPALRQQGKKSLSFLSPKTTVE